MTTREANRLKTTRQCLKCGRVFVTDRCHRLCVKCGHTNEGLLEDKTAVSQELKHWIRSFVRNDGGWRDGEFPVAQPALHEDSEFLTVGSNSR